MNLIVDGNNMAHRARHAYKLSHQGKDTSVTYGVMRMLMALVHKYRPYSVIFCWDGGTPGFRRRMVPSYKSQRKHDEDPTWPIFLEQLRELEDILPCAGVLQVKRRGLEADDLMYHASRMVIGVSLVVSSDDDMLQCVSENVSVLKPGKKSKPGKRERIIAWETFEDDMGYPVFKHVLAKALQGDSSDNIPGVHGIGPKTAVKLMAHKHVLDAATPKMRERIQTFIDSGDYFAAYTAIDLSVDRAGACLTILEAAATWMRYDKQLYKWCMDHGFVSIIEAGPLGATFGRLKKPEFNIDGMRLPRVWDYKRLGE